MSEESFDLKDFDWKTYLKLNQDLDQNYQEKDAIYHYLNYGVYENRQYKDISLPEDFNWKIYLKLNPDLNRNFGEKEAIQHYLNFGYYENRKYKDISIPEDFNWKNYLNLNPDLTQNWEEKDAIYHYKNYGVYENREYKQNIKNEEIECKKSLNNEEIECKKSLNNEEIEYLKSHNEILVNKRKLYENYTTTTITKFIKNNIDIIEKEYLYKILNNPIIFHKYILGLSSFKPILYEIKKSHKLTKNICHIHCFKLSLLKQMFENEIVLLKPYFNIIVTYSIEDNIELITAYDYVTFLKIENIGADVGPRFVINKYLKDIQYNYKYIFFIHSKSNDIKRKQYLDHFINHLSYINKLLNKEEILSGIFNDIILCGDLQGFYVNNLFNIGLIKDNIQWVNNNEYMKEFVDYNGIINNNYLFSEGNFFILSNLVVEKLYSDILFYNILNYPNSFEYQWVKKYYKLDNYNVENVYNEYITNKYFGNNMETGLGWSGLADCCIEHSFERLPMIYIHHFNMSQIKIVSNEISKNINNLKKLEKIVNTNVKKIDEYNDFLENEVNQDILCVISCHTNNNLKIKTLIHNITYFLEISNDIVIINSLEYQNNDIEKQIQEKYKGDYIIFNDLLTDKLCELYKLFYPDIANLNNEQIRTHWIEYGKKEGRNFDKYKVKNIYFHYLKNNNFLCQGKWSSYLNNINYCKYKNIILTNDSFIVTKSLLEFRKLFDLKNIEMISLIDSYENTYHYTDFLRCYNLKGIQKILNYYKENQDKITDFNSVISYYEINSTHIFEDKITLYKNDKKYNGNIHFDDQKIKEYLYEKNYPIIKLKKIQKTVYNDDFPIDFDPLQYVELNSDLLYLNMTNEELTIHFKLCGIKEGRFYKKNQLLVLPGFISEYLKNIGFDIK